MKKNWMRNLITEMSKFEKIFWATILLLFGAYSVLYFLAQNPQQPFDPKTPIFPPIDKSAINDNLKVELQAINNKITQVANDLINTNNVDKFLDFHYSVTGEYTELLMSQTEKIHKIISKKLFGDDFKQREKDALNQINNQFEMSVSKHTAFISNIASKNIDDELNNEALQRLEANIECHKNIQIGKAGFLTTALVSAIIAKTSIKIAKSAAIKLTVKTAGKIAAKGGLTAAVSAVGIFCGPFVGLCAPALAIIAWLGTDYIIIKLDEYWHREEFKQEIIALINNSKDSFIKQYNEVYTTAFKEWSDKLEKIYINSNLTPKDRI